MVVNIDLTEALFPPVEISPEEQRIEERKCNLWGNAEAAARKNLEGRVLFSPLVLLKEAHKLYLSYLAKEGLIYDEERGI